MKYQQSELKIRISQLSEGTHNYQFTTQTKQLELGDNFRGDVEIIATLEKTQRQLYLKCKVSANAVFQCDRCADEFSSGLHASYGICYSYDEEAPVSSSDDEMRFIHQGTPYIEISEDVRQVMLLAVPLKLVCRDDCRGLCPHCGINLNTEMCDCTEPHTDSRWDELKKLIVENTN